jgi:hypothetical protein
VQVVTSARNPYETFEGFIVETPEAGKKIDFRSAAIKIP